MVRAYANGLTRPEWQLWGRILGDHEAAVRQHKGRNPQAGWLMANRFWYEAIVVPLLERDT